jgi:hypothetical protein
MANLAPVPSENNTCAHCGAPLVADQRYCLSCGQPSSPVRLAFLDVLESERQPQHSPGALASVPVAYTPYVEPTAGPAWLRRYAPLFGVLSVLLLALIVGLLVGHWVTQGKSSSSSGTQVIKIEGLPAVAAAPTTTSVGGAATPSGTHASKGKSATSAKSEEAKEEAEAKEEEQEEEKHPAKAPAAKALSSTEASKLGNTTGKKKEAELNKLTKAPVEVK